MSEVLGRARPVELSDDARFAARVRRLLIDSSKFRPPTFMRVAAVRDLDEVITDDGAPRDEVERSRENEQRESRPQPSAREGEGGEDDGGPDEPRRGA